MDIIKILQREIHDLKVKWGEMKEENVALQGFKKMVMEKPQDFQDMKARAEEAEEALANALAGDYRQKEADELMMKKLERIQELESLEESHKKFNGELQNRLTELEQENIELHADNKKLARQVEDQLDRVRKAGL